MWGRPRRSLVSKQAAQQQQSRKYEQRALTPAAGARPAAAAAAVQGAVAAVHEPGNIKPELHVLVPRPAGNTKQAPARQWRFPSQVRCVCFGTEWRKCQPRRQAARPAAGETSERLSGKASVVLCQGQPGLETSSRGDPSAAQSGRLPGRPHAARCDWCRTKNKGKSMLFQQTGSKRRGKMCRLCSHAHIANAPLCRAKQ